MRDRSIGLGNGGRASAASLAATGPLFIRQSRSLGDFRKPNPTAFGSGQASIAGDSVRLGASLTWRISQQTLQVSKEEKRPTKIE
jgi:hypothetical protein